MTELYVLPEGWRWEKLGDIARLFGGGTPKRNVKEYWENGHIVWLSPTDLGEIGEISEISDSKDKITQLGLEKSSAKLLPIGSVLYSSRATIGKIAITTSEVSTNQGFANFVCNEDLDNKYLAYALNRFTPDITLLSNSTTFKEVSKTSLKNFRIPIPPFPEQQRIVKKLDTIFEKIDRAFTLHQKNIDEANAFMGSVLNEVFGGLVEQYGTKPITEIFKIKSGDFLPKKNMIETGQYFVYGGNGINGKHNEFNLNGENIIIGRVGAQCGNVRNVNGPIWITDNAFFVSDLFDDLNKKYLAKALEQINLGKTANQAAQPVISYKSISILSLAIPPVSIQEKSVAYLDAVAGKTEKIKTLQQTKMQSLKALKASILDQAFRGEL